MKTEYTQGQITISDNDVETALLNSGYLIEYRIEKILNEQNYYVQASPVYPDPITQKSREVDLYGLRLRSDPDSGDLIFSCLLIECVNNIQPIAFISKKTILNKTFDYDIKIAGLPVKIIDPDRGKNWIYLPDFLEMSKYHHYCKSRYATQYCSFAQKKNTNDWMAYHEDSHFEAIQKLCDFTNHTIKTHDKDWKPDGKERVNLEFYYPVIIVQGDLIDVRITDQTIAIKKTDHMHFRRNTFQNNSEETYDIDIVTETFLPSPSVTIIVRQLRPII